MYHGYSDRNVEKNAVTRSIRKTMDVIIANFLQCLHYYKIPDTPVESNGYNRR